MEHYVNVKVKFPINLEDYEGMSERDMKSTIYNHIKEMLDCELELISKDIKLHPRTRKELGFN